MPEFLEKGMATHSRVLAWRIPLGRGTWWASVHRVSKSRTRLKWLNRNARTGQVWQLPVTTWSSISLFSFESHATPPHTHFFFFFFWWNEGCRGHLFFIVTYFSDKISMLCSLEKISTMLSFCILGGVSLLTWVPSANDSGLANPCISSPLPQIGSGRITWQAKSMRSLSRIWIAKFLFPLRLLCHPLILHSPPPPPPTHT